MELWQGAEPDAERCKGMAEYREALAQNNKELPRISYDVRSIATEERGADKQRR